MFMVHMNNFDKKNAMVVPSLMSKILSKRPVEVWGDGSPIRDFAYSIYAKLLITMIYGTGKYDFFF